MRISTLFCLWVFIVQNLSAQSDKELVLKVLDDQSVCWNKGDIDCFMEGYWKSGSLMFIGSNGITYGWQATTDRYKKNYPSEEAMGKLSFDILETRAIEPDSYFVVGKFYLKRVIGDLDGYFTLLFKRIGGRWVIVADHTG